MLFERSFGSYLNSVRNDRFEELRTQISYILQTEDLDSIATNIGIFAYTENIEIEIFDKNNISVALYNPLDDSRNKEILTKEYKLINDGNVIGTMRFSYYETNELDEITKTFKRNLIFTLIILGILSVLIGTITSYALSVKSSKDIEKLSKMAKDYKNNDYSKTYNINSDIVEISELAHNMNYLGESLKKQRELRKNYSQNISHELRTPLTNLLLYIEAIKDGIISLDEATLQSIREEIYHMNSLINKLRLGFNEDITINENKIEEFNLSENIYKITSGLSPTVKANGIDFSIKIQEDVIVKSDKEKITQILYNLLSNAFKACEKGDKVEVLMKERDKEIIISIIDTGIGIEEEELTKIFDRNYRIKNKKNEEVTGSGLGLSIVKDLVYSLGGKIHVKSKKGYGSNFIVHIPKEI